jgi:hypothetical protein
MCSARLISSGNVSCALGRTFTLALMRGGGSILAAGTPTAPHPFRSDFPTIKLYQPGRGLRGQPEQLVSVVYGTGIVRLRPGRPSRLRRAHAARDS